MKAAREILHSMAFIALLALLAGSVAFAVQRLAGRQALEGSASLAASPVVRVYPYPQGEGALPALPPATDTPFGYPPPPTSAPLPSLTPWAVYTHTPWPSMTPYPTPTLRPGPSYTPIPLVEPAKDASGSIVYLSRAADGAHAVGSLSVDATGQVKGLPGYTSIEGNWFPERSIFPSPDGSRYALMGDWGDTSFLDTQTGDLAPLPLEITPGLFFGWFPDSLQVLKRSTRGLELANIQSGERTPLAVTNFGKIDGTSASPDGKKIVYSHGHGDDIPTEVWVVNADGREAHRLFTTPATVTDFVWSPDGKLIVFIGDSLEVMDADGANRHKLVNQSLPVALCYSTPLKWSPDSRLLAVQISDEGDSFCAGWSEKAFSGTNIFLIEVESGKSYPMLPDGSAGNIDPAWSPDGTQIVFISNRNGGSEIWAVSVDGSNLRQLTFDGQTVRFPIWRNP
jgi:TolB protein